MVYIKAIKTIFLVFSSFRLSERKSSSGTLEMSLLRIRIWKSIRSSFTINYNYNQFTIIYKLNILEVINPFMMNPPRHLFNQINIAI